MRSLLGVGGGRPAQAQVVGDADVEQVDVLGHVGDLAAQVVRGEGAHVVAAKGDAAVLRIPKAQQDVRAGGFPGS